MLRPVILSILLFTSQACFGQAESYNPDSNGDGSINVTDLLTFLSLFGSNGPWPSQSNTCILTGYLQTNEPRTFIATEACDKYHIYLANNSIGVSNLILPDSTIQNREIVVTFSRFSIYTYEQLKVWTESGTLLYQVNTGASDYYGANGGASVFGGGNTSLGILRFIYVLESGWSVALNAYSEILPSY